MHQLLLIHGNEQYNNTNCEFKIGPFYLKIEYVKQ